MRGRSGFDEPRVFDRRVVDDEIHDDTHAELVSASDEPIEGVQIPEERINVSIVGDIVAVVCLRGSVDRGDPHDIDAEVSQIVQALMNPLQITVTVTVRVLERTRVDLVEDGILPPGRDAGARRGEQIRVVNHEFLRSVLLGVERRRGDVLTGVQVLNGVAGESKGSALAGVNRSLKGALHEVLQITLVGLAVAGNRPVREASRCRRFTERKLALVKNIGFLIISERIVTVLIPRLGGAVPGTGR